MTYSFAPLEGLTDRVYRRLHHEFFPVPIAYYTPFFSPTVHRSLTPREAKELPIVTPDSDFAVIPQLLTKSASDFLWMAQVCADRGYGEVNLNLGCPSGTVVSKGKGSGMLRDLPALEAFLSEIYANTPLPVSLKTRIGLEDPQEFPALLDMFNAFPVKQLIIHPRVRSDFYKHEIRMEQFQYALNHSKNPLSYNGNLSTRQEIKAFTSAFPQVNSLMIGRGLIGNPGLLSPAPVTGQQLSAFYDALLEQYLIEFGGSRNAMFRLKEHWRYLICLFDGADQLSKKLRKTTSLSEYRSITRELFENTPLRSELSPDW